MIPERATAFVDDWIVRDEAFHKEMFAKHGAATFCPDCGKNTATGLYPFFHIKRRRLCVACGKNYKDVLKTLGLWET